MRLHQKPVLLTKYHTSDQIMKHEMGRVCGMLGEEKAHLKDLSIDRRILQDR
jgi:hypothetical protein